MFEIKLKIWQASYFEKNRAFEIFLNMWTKSLRHVELFILLDFQICNFSQNILKIQENKSSLEIVWKSK